MEADKIYNVPVNIKKKYLKVREVLNEHEAMSNPSEPYEKKYEAIKILKEMIEELDAMLTSSTEPKNEAEMLAITRLNLGILHSDTEETKTAEEQFTMCIGLLKDRELEPKVILPVISALNQLGILYAQWSEPLKAKISLERAEKLYIDFTENIQLDPVNMGITMGMEDIEGELSAGSVLEKLHTLTLYYLAQVYGSLDDKHKFAAYCHRTLSKQLSQDNTTHDLDYIDWALNAATLSQYYIEHENFPQARYHLAAASYILQKYQNTLEAKGPKETSEIIAAEYETFHHRSADIARCWAKYGITLLSASKERLLRSVEEEDQCLMEDSKSITEPVKFTIDLRFVDIEPELETITNQITDQYLLVFDDARPVFLNIQKWLDKAKTYYTLDNHASDYARIAQDISQAYKYLSFFEEQEDRQAKMDKRRIDVLEDVIKELNPQYYRTICREIWIELGETYSHIMDLKMNRLCTSNENQAVQITKINHLARSSIKHFRSYLDSLEISKSANGVESFSDDQLYQALYTYFQIGRLYNRIVTSNDIQMKIENMQKSLEAYQFIMHYYDKHPEKAEDLKSYGIINISKNFVTLLPLTLHKLRQKLINQ